MALVPSVYLPIDIVAALLAVAIARDEAWSASFSMPDAARHRVMWVDHIVALDDIRDGGRLGDGATHQRRSQRA